MASPIRIAVVGAGAIGPRHAHTVVGNPRASLCAVVDPTPRGADLAHELGVPHYTSVGELVASEHRPDGAIVCTPNHTHVPVALELVEAGVHVLVEKPVSTDIESGRRLISRASARGVQVLVGHHRRFNSYIVAAKAAIESGGLGDIVAVNGLWTTYKPPEYFDPPAEWKRDQKTGGVILINMIHEVDLLHHLVGPVVRVYAEKTRSRRKFDAEEGAAITLRFENGAVGSFLLSDNVPSPHSFEAGTGENPLIPRTGQDFYRIFGSEATLSVPDLRRWSYDDHQGTATTAKSWHAQMAVRQIPVTPKIPFESQLDHFLEVIRGNEDPKCTGKDGLAALIVCDALKRSLETGLPVDITHV